PDHAHAVRRDAVVDRIGPVSRAVARAGVAGGREEKTNFVRDHAVALLLADRLGNAAHTADDGVGVGSNKLRGHAVGHRFREVARPPVDGRAHLESWRQLAREFRRAVGDYARLAIGIDEARPQYAIFEVD